MKKWIFLAVTLFLMVLIFCLSAQEGEQSYALSQEVAQQMQENTATQTVVPAWFSENFHANVRKWAHVYLYALLGISVALTVSGFAGLCWQKQAGTTALCCGGIAAAICFAYAAGDELHQYFVPGRACLVTDVFVDSIGFLPGIAVVCWLWYRHIRKMCR